MDTSTRAVSESIYCAMRVLSLVLFSCMANGAQSSDADVLNLDIEDARPVGRAVETLVLRHGIAITYEDPRYEFSGDMKPIVREVGEADVRGIREKRQFLVPAGGQLKRTYPISLETGQPLDVQTTLQSLIEVGSGDKGAYRIERAEGMYHIIPARTRNSAGAVTERSSILETPIELPDQEQTGVETLASICSQLSDATGTRVVIGTVPMKLLSEHRGRVEAENDSARVVLTRLFSSTGRKLTWLLFYDPELRWYALNILSVPDQSSPDAIEPLRLPRTSGPGPAEKTRSR